MMKHAEAVTGRLVHLDQSDREPEGQRVTKRRLVSPPPQDDAISKFKRSKETCRSVPTAVIDKSALYRAGLTHILADTRFRVIADCASLNDLPERLLNQHETMILLGIGSDADATLSQLAHLRETHGTMRVIMLSERFSSEQALAAIKAGGSCYLAKHEVSPDVLLKSLELALLGAIVVSGELAGDLVNGRIPPGVEAATPGDGPAMAAACASPNGESPQAPGLSARERLILSHLMQGDSNKHIARDLGIAEATVKVHVKSLLRKVRVRNRTQAAMWGINHLAPISTEPRSELLAG